MEGKEQKRLIVPILAYLAVICAFWIVDAGILSFYKEGLDFGSALFGGASLPRLLFRGLATALLLYLLINKIRQFFQSNQTYNFWMAGGDEFLYNGSAESDKRSQRLLYHCLRLANVFKMKNKDKENLRLLCYCYDLGKIGVPLAVIEKDAPLTPSEQELWDKHVELGAQIASIIKPLSSAANLIMHHEEYYSGGGYLGVRDRHIPLACRIFKVVWMYDCMIYPNGRCRPMLCDEALLELQYYAGSALDPGVVDAFINMMSRPNLLQGYGKKVFSFRAH